MSDSMTRRAMLKTAGIAAATGMVSRAIAAAPQAAEGKDRILIVGVACSPRKGKTTATAVQAALDAAKSVDPRIAIELFDLGGMSIAGSDGSSSSGAPAGFTDDFNLLLPTLQSPDLGGLIIGSPCYYRTMSALCKSFLERLAVLREPKLALADKPVGALSVGSYRNGGQELVIEQIQTVMLCHEMMLVGGKPKAHQGATLWNNFQDDITKDEFGIDSARKLGVRVAEAALRLAVPKG